MNIRNEVKIIKDQIISWRRYFHENPELSFKEYNTAKKITSELKSMGLKPKTKVGRTYKRLVVCHSHPKIMVLCMLADMMGMWLCF